MRQHVSYKLYNLYLYSSVTTLILVRSGCFVLYSALWQYVCLAILIVVVCLIDRSEELLIDEWIYRSIDSLMNQLIDQSVTCLTNESIDWSMDWFIK